MDILFLEILLTISSLILFCVMASKFSARYNIPGLIIFLGLGIAFGKDFFNLLPPLDLNFAQHFGMLSLVLILFSGGLESHWKQVRPILKSGISLATLGVLITSAAVACFGNFVLHLSWPEGFLLGAIISSTDAAAVFAVLSTKGMRLKDGVNELLEFESGCNDPMAVFLTLAIVEFLTSKEIGIQHIFTSLVWEMFCGAAFGVLIGRGAALFIDKLKLESEGLYPVLTIAICLFTYASCALIHGNGFLAVYLCGLTLGSSQFIKKHTIKVFHGGIAWLAQITMFLLLGLLVSLHQLSLVLLSGLGLAVFLVLIARPLSVHTSLLFSHFSFRQKSMISWVGLRGAVPIILAIYPMSAELPIASSIFHLVFFVVILSVLIQSLLITPFARKLGLAESVAPKHFEEAAIETKEGSLQEILVSEGMGIQDKTIMEYTLPRNVIIVLIKRGKETITPRGETKILKGDTLLVFAKEEDRVHFDRPMKYKAEELKGIDLSSIDLDTSRERNRR